MKTLKYKPDLFQYFKRGYDRWGFPIAEVNEDGSCPYPEGYTEYDQELDGIEADFGKYADNLGVIKAYIDDHRWIKLYLYWDETTKGDITSLWSSIKTTPDEIAQNVKDFIDRVCIIIDKSIEKEGDIIPYLKNRYDIHYANYKQQQEHNADYDDDEEGHILDFLSGLIAKINKIMRITKQTETIPSEDEKLNTLVGQINNMTGYKDDISDIRRDLNEFKQNGWITITNSLPIKIPGITKQECADKAIRMLYRWKPDIFKPEILEDGKEKKAFYTTLARELFVPNIHDKILEFTDVDLRKAKSEISSDELD